MKATGTFKEILARAVCAKGDMDITARAKIPIGSPVRVLGTTCSDLTIDVLHMTEDDKVLLQGTVYAHVWYELDDRTDVVKQSIAVNEELVVSPVTEQPFAYPDVMGSVSKEFVCSETEVVDGAITVYLMGSVHIEVTGEVAIVVQRRKPVPETDEDDDFDFDFDDWPDFIIDVRTEAD